MDRTDAASIAKGVDAFNKAAGCEVLIAGGYSQGAAVVRSPYLDPTNNSMSYMLTNRHTDAQRRPKETKRRAQDQTRRRRTIRRYQEQARLRPHQRIPHGEVKSMV